MKFLTSYALATVILSTVPSSFAASYSCQKSVDDNSCRITCADQTTYSCNDTGTLRPLQNRVSMKKTPKRGSSVTPNPRLACQNVDAEWRNARKELNIDKFNEALSKKVLEVEKRRRECEAKYPTLLPADHPCAAAEGEMKQADESAVIYDNVDWKNIFARKKDAFEQCLKAHPR